MAISVPKPVRPALLRLATIDDEMFRVAIEALRSMPVLFDTKDIEKYSDDHAAAIEPNLFRDIARVAISVAYGRVSTDLDGSKFASEVLDAVRDWPETKDTEFDAEQLRRRIIEMLSVQPIVVAAKALNLRFDTQRHMEGVRVLTDVRPIFGDSVSTDPAAFVILHNLKIEYHEQSTSELRNFFSTLDVQDLMSIREAVNRAIDKEHRLRVMFANAGMNLVGLEKEAGTRNGA